MSLNILINKHVFIYRNLHKKCWSVRCKKTRKVIAHLDAFVLYNCVFKVSESGRQRVLKEKKKNVHAGIEGYIWQTDVDEQIAMVPVRYNPYEAANFVSNGNPIERASFVTFTKKGAFV